MSNEITVLLAEDHILVRAGIRALVEDLGNTKVVGEADNGKQAVELVANLSPDLLFMDIAMPILNGLDATEQIIQQYPKMKIIILSMHASEEYVLKALQAGAVGYMMKDADMSELKMAVDAVLSGKIFLSPVVSQHVASYIRRTNDNTQQVAQPPSAPIVDSAELDLLTPRQREILTLIADGCSTKEIAHQLSISIKTAEAHRANIMNRLEIYDIAGLVRFALRHRLVED